MAPTCVMFILPHHLFDVVKTDEGILKFIPNQFVFTWIKANLGCTKVSVHSYIKRHVKQIGIKELIILIPRVIVSKALQKTHVLLPEFILPFSRYTTKSLAIIFSEDLTFNFRITIKKKDWDRATSLSTNMQFIAVTRYLKYRKIFLIERYKELGIKLINRRISITAFFSPRLNLIKKFYFFVKKNKCINILTYFFHTLSDLDSS